MSLTYQDARINWCSGSTLALWYFTGDEPYTYYATKAATEAAALARFPNEDPDKRYARIYYRILYGASED